MSSPELVIVGDLGGTNCRVGVASVNGLIDGEIVPTTQDADELFNHIGEQVLRFTDTYPDIRSGAFGFPGPVTRSEKPTEVGPFVNIPALATESFVFSERLSAEKKELSSMPFLSLNDAEAATLAAARQYDKNDNKKPLMYITMSTGVGGDIALNYETLSYSAGLLTELGHMPFAQADGSYATLENRVSGPAIERIYGKGKKTVQQLAEAPQTDEIWNSIGRDLARGLGVLVTPFGINKIVIGGGVGSNHQNRIEPPYRRVMSEMFEAVPEVIAKAPDTVFVDPKDEKTMGLIGCFWAIQQRRAELAAL